MKIICRNCGRIVDLAELSIYLLAYFVERMPEAAAQIVWEGLKFSILRQARGPIDSGMAGCANVCNITCPQCKVDNKPWAPCPGDELETLKQKISV